MDAAFLIAAGLTLAAAVAAMSLRNLIHCALCLVLAFFGVAALFLRLGAEFVSFAQVLVYVGAIAILIVFVTLLTRSTGTTGESLAFQPWQLGVGIAGLVAGAVVACVLGSRLLPAPDPAAVARTAPSTRELGEQLMSTYVLPLEVVGLLLTSALIGAVVLAVREPKSSAPPAEP